MIAQRYKIYFHNIYRGALFYRLTQRYLLVHPSRRQYKIKDDKNQVAREHTTAFDAIFQKEDWLPQTTFFYLFKKLWCQSLRNWDLWSNSCRGLMGLWRGFLFSKKKKTSAKCPCHQGIDPIPTKANTLSRALKKRAGCTPLKVYKSCSTNLKSNNKYIE